MKCPFCRQSITEIFNSRATKSGTQTWRRRHCLNCGKSFTTYEAPDLKFLKITPLHGPSRRFSRAQLFSSLYEAFQDLPHKADTIDAVTDTIEAKLLDLQRPNLTPAQIATITLETLKHFHTPAFLRYLSAHGDVTTPKNLKKALRQY
jgi:transcriptional repressor NrdR